VGIDDMFLSTVNIYPNPTTGLITIEIEETTSESVSLTIQSINGKTLMSKQINQRKTVLDVSDIPNGIYFITIVDKDQIGRFKMIKS